MRFGFISGMSWTEASCFEWQDATLVQGPEGTELISAADRNTPTKKLTEQKSR